jgi:type I restriction enzyme M protein
MISETIMAKTKTMIDDLKTVCANYGLGNASSEYKIITEVFLYKFLNDKFLHEVRQVDESLGNCDNLEETLSNMKEDDYEFLLASLPPATAQLKREHFISYLFNNKNTDNFNELFDATLVDIANFNIDVFSVKTGSEDKIRLFDALSVFVTETNKRSDFCRAIIDKLVAFSFEEAFSQKYDFFAAVFEYLIKDYNKDFGKYAEYYTPHSIASIIAKIMVPEAVCNVNIYDPAAGSGTLVLALAHEIGEDNCTIYTQDISQKSNEFLRLNLILNNLVHSLGNVVHGDTLLEPQHLNKQKNGLMKFDYIVSNPPFNVDFSDNRDTLAGDNYSERFWAGVPKVPNKDKDKMAIYLMFLQHIIYSLKEDTGKAAIVVPTGFLTAGSGIPKAIREKIVGDRILRGVISMPSNIFATTGTNVSILFLDKEHRNEKVILMDASKLGHKEKVDGKNQRTVLESEEIQKIIDTFNNKEQVDDFSVLVDYDQIEQKKMSFSAGQYFEVKIEYVELTPEEFTEKMDNYTKELQELFAEGDKLQKDILEQLGKVRYE